VVDTGSRVTLHLLHGGGGGLEASVRLLAERQPGRRHALLFVRGPSAWDLEAHGGGRRPVSFPQWNGLARTVRSVGADLVHVHHLGGDRHRLLRGLARLTVPYGVTIHDFHLVCPRVHLVPPGAMYCGAPTDPDVCRQCLAVAPRLRVDPVRWRREHRALMRGASFVAAPSRFVAEVLGRYWPDLKVTHAPHVYRPAGLTDHPPVEPDEQGWFTVGVVGALGREKGGEMLERIAALAEQRNLPLRFVMLGDTHRLGGPQSLYGDHLFVHGGYRRAELPSLLRQHRVMVAAFPAIGPETFSLTLSEVWACGLPALVPDLGALAERVRATGAGWILRQWQSPEAWLESLMDHLRHPASLSEASHRARVAAEAAPMGLDTQGTTEPK
jgi:O-antigen biosynthesis protein